jgi:hypothetical protein
MSSTLLDIASPPRVDRRGFCTPLLPRRRTATAEIDDK